MISISQNNRLEKLLIYEISFIVSRVNEFKLLTRATIEHKAELPLEGIFFALNFLPWEFLLIKKLEIEKTKNT